MYVLVKDFYKNSRINMWQSFQKKSIIMLTMPKKLDILLNVAAKEVSKQQKLIKKMLTTTYYVDIIIKSL
ncbi:hypothetical protein NG54_07295 [Heyndrickxia ginsengihumi]|uniref:Uncharacterized protein n=1 Tax=Heyndrickxia ginsengihumi TaxID=363870 RepID=A0A0A6VGE7_9BACI|nr:hypothetical protein NG54_07295 [Heyndrickxia ginsengihumi]